MQRLVYDLFRQQNRRTLGQVRGTNAGASSLPFVIYNDNYAFDEYITGNCRPFIGSFEFE